MLVIGVWRAAYALGATVDVQFYAVLLMVFGVIFGLYGYLAHIQKCNIKLYHALLRFGECTHVGHSRWSLKFRELLDKE